VSTNKPQIENTLHPETAVSGEGLAMNEDSRKQLTVFVAHVGMLRHAIARDATRDQIIARLEQLHTDASALSEVLSTEDGAAGDEVKKAWLEPEKALARFASRIERK
jgi:oligoendopeptidase F